MSRNRFLIKDGIVLHAIKTDLFKTNLICVMLTTPLKRETVTRK